MLMASAILALCNLCGIFGWLLDVPGLAGELLGVLSEVSCLPWAKSSWARDRACDCQTPLVNIDQGIINRYKGVQKAKTAGGETDRLESL
jgi:hypothetical protein